MDTVKMDDPRLDESYSFLFAFKKGDRIRRKGETPVRGEIIDGVYVGEFPGPNAGDVHPRGKTLYEIKLRDGALQIIDEAEIEREPK
jgi:hypothetical protein